MRWRALPYLTLALIACAPAKKEGTGETAATAVAPAPVVKSFAAPAAADITWQEWAAVGAADARLDWPAGAVAVGGKLYLVGTRKVNPSSSGHRPRAEVVFLSVAPHGLREVAAYPSDFGERAKAAAAAGPGGRIWFIGGMYTPPAMKTVPEGVLEFTPLAEPMGEVNGWKRGGAGLELETYLPVPRGEAAAFFNGGELYVVGGVYDKSKPLDTNNRQIHRYNARDGLWTKLHDIPVPLAAPAAAVARNGLFVIGGRQLTPVHITNRVWRYDLTVFKWQRQPPLPAPRAGAKAVVVDGFIYVLGGVEGEGAGGPGRPALKIFRFDLTARRWEELATALPEGCSLVAFDGSYFYLVGRHKTYRGRLVKAKR